MLESWPALVLLHGRGADETDLLGLTPVLDERFCFISARAPLPFEGGFGSTWYSLSDAGKPVQKEFAQSLKRLRAFLQEIRGGYPVDARRVFLLGFSMGTMMAYAIALTQPDSIAGLVAHSGYVPEAAGLTYRLHELGSLGIFIAHGLHDPVIPVSLGRRSKELLQHTSARVTYREYPIEHSVSEQSIEDIRTWLTDELNRTI